MNPAPQSYILNQRQHGAGVFRQGELWKNELEELAMSLLDSYDVILGETSPGCVFEVH